jgi:nitrogen fixation/metabolism regulation signal transduction histidine kinase
MAASIFSNPEVTTIIRRYAILYGIFLLVAVFPFIVAPMGCSPNCEESLRIVGFGVVFFLLVSFGFCTRLELSDLRKTNSPLPLPSTLAVLFTSYFAAPGVLLLIFLGYTIFQLLGSAWFFIVYKLLNVTGAI